MIERVKFYSKLPMMPAAPAVEHTLPSGGAKSSIPHREQSEVRFFMELFLRKEVTDSTLLTA